MPVFTKAETDTDAPDEERNVSLAVIIPTKNRPDDLEGAIRSLLAQTVLPRETIIVDQSPTEQSRQRVEQLFEQLLPPDCPRVHLIYIHDPQIIGAAVAKNCGLASVHSEYVLFLDDDVILEKRFIEAIVHSFSSHPEVDGVSGIVTNYNPPSVVFRVWSRMFMCGPFWDDRQPIYWNAARLHTDILIPVTRFGAGLMAFRTKVIEHIRFDDSLRGVPGGEDVDFCMRLQSGVKLVIAPGARLLHKQTPVARIKEHWLYRHARTNRYLYIRNWKHGISSRLAYAWLNIGYALAAMASCAYRRSLDPLNLLRDAKRDADKLLQGASITNQQPAQN